MTTLARSELLAGLEPQHITALVNLADTVSLQSGTRLFSLGDRADNLYVVLSGRVLLSLPLNIKGGPQDVFVEEKRPGEILGWSALVPPHRFTLSASARMDSTLAVFRQDQLKELFEQVPALGHTVILNLATVLGNRLHKVQAMWVREVQRGLDLRFGTVRETGGAGDAGANGPQGR